MIELLRKLCSAPGTSGEEKDIARLVTDELAARGCEVSLDPNGNVIARRGEKKDAVLLEAHMDKIGFIVTGVTDEGFLRFAKVGGSDRRVAAASRVRVFGKEKFTGVITSVPPHLGGAKDGCAAEFDKMYIDVGMSKEKASELVSPGDRAEAAPNFTKLLNGRVASQSLDDRAGVAVILRTLDILAEKAPDVPVNVLVSVKEETGGQGAQTGAFALEPETAISFDVSFARDPSVSEPVYGKLGSGELIGFSPILDGDLSRELVRIAEDKKIPYFTEVSGSRMGADCDDIAVSRCGVRAALISIPQRNMHTSAEIVDTADIEACASLTAEYIISHGRDPR